MVGRLLLALCFVLGLMWVIARWVRGRNGGRRNAAAMTVLARQQLSRNSAIAVVKVLDQALIIGVTDGQVSKLGDTDLAQFEAESAAAQRPPLRLVAAKRPPTDEDAFESPQALAAGGSARVPGGSARGAGGSALAGSALSLGTWRQAIDVLRERTVRRG